MSADGFKDLSPIITRIQLVNLKKGLITVRRSRDQRRLFFNETGAGDPVKRIAPAKLLESTAARFLKLAQKVNRSFEISGVSGCLVQGCESHCIMGVGDWKTNAMMELTAHRRKECFKKDKR